MVVYEGSNELGGEQLILQARGQPIGGRVVGNELQKADALCDERQRASVSDSRLLGELKNKPMQPVATVPRAGMPRKLWIEEEERKLPAGP